MILKLPGSLTSLGHIQWQAEYPILRNIIRLCFWASSIASASQSCHATGLFMCARTYLTVSVTRLLRRAGQAECVRLTYGDLLCCKRLTSFGPMSDTSCCDCMLGDVLMRGFSGLRGEIHVVISRPKSEVLTESGKIGAKLERARYYPASARRRSKGRSGSRSNGWRAGTSVPQGSSGCTRAGSGGNAARRIGAQPTELA